MTAQTAPRLASNPPPKPYVPSELKIDPPPKDGPQIGHPVICWHGPDEPTDPLKLVSGVVTMLGHDRRLAVTLFPKDTYAVFADSVIAHDDENQKGKLPGSWRWKPAPLLTAVQALEAKLEDLTRQLAEMKVSLKPKT